MHVVIAKLTDQQFTQLENSGIPYREFPQQFLDRIQQLDPQRSLDEIFELLVKRGFASMAGNAFRQEKMQAADSQVRQYVTDLQNELGL